MPGDLPTTPLTTAPEPELGRRAVLRETALLGLHHVTAFAKSPAANRRFYGGVLGLRPVKRTVNFDDPSTWHLYYGDHLGRPGTLLTFFADPRLAPGRVGEPGIAEAWLSVPARRLGMWAARLHEHGVEPRPTSTPRGEALIIHDPDALPLVLMESPFDAQENLAVAGVTLTVPDPEATAIFLTEALGFRHGPSADGTVLRIGERGDEACALLRRGTRSEARLGAGVIHHVAWRVADLAALQRMRSRLMDRGVRVSTVRDRRYFQSIYFQEPGGVRFELATDGPGFTVDEDQTALGETLQLPPDLEPRRAALQATLPPLE